MGFKKWVKNTGKAVSNVAGNVANSDAAWLVNPAVAGNAAVTQQATGGNILGQQGQKEAAGAIEQGYGQGIGAVKDYYGKAGKDIQGINQAKGDITKGYGEAEKQVQEGKQSLGQGYDAAMAEAKGASAKAKGEYNTPEFAQTRQELYNRILGKGGFSNDTLAKMKSGTVEDAGVSAQMVKDALGGGQLYGDSMGSNATLGQALSDIARERQSGLRNVDIQNAMLQEQQQSEAIPMMNQITNTQAGLDTDLGKALYEAQIGKGQGLYGGSMAEAGLSKDQADTLAGLQTKLALGNTQLSQEEAQLLAQLYANQGTAVAGTKDTEGLKPLIAGGIGGLASGVGMGMGKG